MTQVPDYMPVLGNGSHVSPKEGACVMEYVSILAGEPFSDTPACTNRVLGMVAMNVNDSLTNDERQLLVPYIGRLIGTSDQSVAAAQAVADAVTEYVKRLDTVAGHDFSTVFTRIVDDSTSKIGYVVVEYKILNRRCSSCDCDYTLEAATMVGMLDVALEAYEKATGHTGRELSETEYRTLAAATR